MHQENATMTQTPMLNAYANNPVFHISSVVDNIRLISFKPYPGLTTSLVLSPLLLPPR